MKFFFKLTFLCLLPCLTSFSYARDIILVTYGTKDQQSLAQHAERVMVRDLNLPREFISIRQTKRPCEKAGRPVVHFCLNDQGELWPVVFDSELVVKSFKVFLDSDRGAQR
jgi:hypothetical protein